MKALAVSLITLAALPDTSLAQSHWQHSASREAIQVSGDAAASIDTKALRRGIANLRADLIARRYDRIFDALPPKYVVVLRSTSTLTTTELRADYIRRQTEGGSAAKLTAVVVQFQEGQVRPGRRGTLYAVLPTQRSIRSSDGKTLKIQGSTLAVYDKDRWYFIVLDTNQQLKLAKRAYRDLRSVKWPGLRIVK